MALKYLHTVGLDSNEAVEKRGGYVRIGRYEGQLSREAHVCSLDMVVDGIGELVFLLSACW